MIFNSILDCLPYFFKQPFHYVVDYWHSLFNDQIKKLKTISSDTTRYVLMGVPEHGNMGDQTIVYAEEQFIHDYFYEELIEISRNIYRGNRSRIRRLIKNTDVILITGGGSLGSLWKNEHNHIEQIIKDFSYNPIVIFPQTIYYDLKDGEEDVLTFREILRNHGNVTMCLREHNSYCFALKKDLLPREKLMLIPDIVLYLNFTGRFTKSNTSSYCLVAERDDKEKVNSLEDIALMSSKHFTIERCDTIIRHLRVTKTNRERTILNLIEKFANADIVLTDRLHGMILSVISGTPCLARDNSSKKVSGVYELISDLPLVKFVGSDESLSESSIVEFSKQPHVYDNKNLKKYYDHLADEIQKLIK